HGADPRPVAGPGPPPPRHPRPLGRGRARPAPPGSIDFRMAGRVRPASRAGTKTYGINVGFSPGPCRAGALAHRRADNAMDRRGGACPALFTSHCWHGPGMPGPYGPHVGSHAETISRVGAGHSPPYSHRIVGLGRACPAPTGPRAVHADTISRVAAGHAPPYSHRVVDPSRACPAPTGPPSVLTPIRFHVWARADRVAAAWRPAVFP